MQNKEIKKVPVYLFNEENPKGEMFSFYGGTESIEYKELIDSGWVDTPARLNLPKDLDSGIPMEDARNANPDDLKKLVESYGFVVITPEQLKAEAVKMADISLNMENFSDDDIINEAVKRGLKAEDDSCDIVTIDKLIDSGAGSADDVEETLLDKFKQDNQSLSDEELLQLGKELKLNFKSSWKSETMITKLNEKVA